MEATPSTDRLTLVVTELVNLIVAQVTEKITSQMEDIAKEQAEMLLDDYDPTSVVNWDDAVEDVVREHLSNATWSVSYEG